MLMRSVFHAPPDKSRGRSGGAGLTRAGGVFTLRGDTT
jgi:hypothetical protein